MITACRSCGASVFWVKSTLGKNMPLNATPERRFVIVTSPDGVSYAQQQDTYVSHFATCPDAAKWRQTGE